jgi:hypothetical protein
MLVKPRCSDIVSRYTGSSPAGTQTMTEGTVKMRHSTAALAFLTGDGTSHRP